MPCTIGCTSCWGRTAPTGLYISSLLPPAWPLICRPKYPPPDPDPYNPSPCRYRKKIEADTELDRTDLTILTQTSVLLYSMYSSRLSLLPAQRIICMYLIPPEEKVALDHPVVLHERTLLRCFLAKLQVCHDTQKREKSGIYVCMYHISFWMNVVHTILVFVCSRCQGEWCGGVHMVHITYRYYWV